MLNFYRTPLLILGQYASVYDIYIVGISPTLGKLHILAKNAASKKSKRRIQLKRGNLLNAVIFHKNRYYLSDSVVKMSFFTKLTRLNEVKALELFLQLIEGFYIYADYAEFNEIIKILENTFITNKYNIMVGTILLLYLFRLLPNGVKCNICSKTKLQGFITNRGWVCNKCINDLSIKDKFELSFISEKDTLNSLNRIINAMLK